MNRYAVAMSDWRGKWWDFTGKWSAGIKSGGVTGLVGSISDSTTSPIGEPGQVVTDQAVENMRGTLTFHCRADGDRDAGQVQADLRAAFSALKSRQNEITLNSPMGEVHALVRLDGKHNAVVEDPSWDDDVVLNVEIPVVGDKGVWWADVTDGADTVTVTNWGDVFLWVEIVWSGPGGVVTLPSGATFILPPATETRTLSLSRAKSLAVRDMGGNLDPALHQQLRGVPPEGVPVGESRTFTVPEGASVRWKIGVLDPWR